MRMRGGRPFGVRGREQRSHGRTVQGTHECGPFRARPRPSPPAHRPSAPRPWAQPAQDLRSRCLACRRGGCARRMPACRRSSASSRTPSHTRCSRTRRDDHEVEGPLAERLVRDVDVSATRVMSVRPVHAKSLPLQIRAGAIARRQLGCSAQSASPASAGAGSRAASLARRRSASSAGAARHPQRLAQPLDEALDRELAVAQLASLVLGARAQSAPAGDHRRFTLRERTRPLDVEEPPPASPTCSRADRPARWTSRRAAGPPRRRNDAAGLPDGLALHGLLIAARRPAVGTAPARPCAVRPSSRRRSGGRSSRVS